MGTRARCSLVLVALLTMGGPVVAEPETRTKLAGVPDAVLRAFPAVVRIFVVVEEPSNGRLKKFSAAGSGAIISADGYVVTNHHVAGKASHIVCNLADQQDVPARLVGTDPVADVAVLKLDTSRLRESGTLLPVARWGDSDSLRVGDAVFAMGSPGAISQSVTKGIVANDRMIMPRGVGGGAMKLDGEDVGSIVRWIAHDAAIFGGNSGGPLLNGRGEIIGINEIGFAGLSGAIPGNLARAVATQLIGHGEVPRAWLGVRLQARLAGQTRGALVSHVDRFSPAAKAGLEPGDLLLSVGDVSTSWRIDEEVPVATARIFDLEIGKTVKATVLRGDRELQVQVTPERREPAQRPVEEVRRLGLTCTDLTQSIRTRLSLEDPKGAVINGVRSSGAAAAAVPALQVDDVVVRVDESLVTSSKAFRAAIEAVPGEQAVLEVLRDKARLIILARLSPPVRRLPAARPSRAWLPLRTQVVTAELAKALGVDASDAVRVTRVLEAGDTPFQVGDIVTTVGGRTIRARRASDSRALQRVVERQQVGAVVPVTLIRAGKTLTVEAQLGSTPRSAARLPTFEVATLEFTCRSRSGMKRKGTRGVVVSEVVAGGWAALAGLRRGDIVYEFASTAVNNVDEFATVSTKALAARPAHVVLLVERDHITRFLDVVPVWR